MYKIIIDLRQWQGLEYSREKDYAIYSFNRYIELLKFKDVTYKNNYRKIWLTKTDLKYVRPFLSSLNFESVPFEIQAPKEKK